MAFGLETGRSVVNIKVIGVGGGFNTWSNAWSAAATKDVDFVAVKHRGGAERLQPNYKIISARS